MRNLFYTILVLLTVYACAGKREIVTEQKQVLPAVEDVVMYEINPRVFALKNAFNVISKHLDSIQFLGVNVVWFMPIYEIGEVNTVNSPYCIKDYKRINPEFGTVEEFKRLVELCHEKGISVIFDWVANHTSWDHAWIKEHKEWYTQDSIGNIISPAGTGWNDVADLNYDNADMCLAMIDAMKYWIQEVGVDGFRCDAADYVPYTFWKQAVDSLRAIPNRKLLMLAEGKRKDHFDAGFDMNYAWDLMEAMRDVFVNDSSAARLLEVDWSEYDSIPAGKMKLRFITNHDEASKMSPIVELGSERAAMAAFVGTVFLHGGALIYSSQEIGHEAPINFFAYTSVDWSECSDIYQEYGCLMGLYNKYPALRKGILTGYPASDVLMYQKSDGKDAFMILVNVRNRDVSVILPEGWKHHVATDIYENKPLELMNEIKLNALEYRIIRF